MNNSTGTNSKEIILYTVPKFILFFLGTSILESSNQFTLSMSQLTGHSIELKLLKYIIPLTIITIFTFYRLGLKNYFVGSLIFVGFIYLLVMQKPPEDEFRMFMESNTYYVIWSFIGGLLVTEAFIDPEAAKAKIIQFAKVHILVIKNYIKKFWAMLR